MKFVVFGGGGKIARHFARIASNEGHQVISVIRNGSHESDLKSLGAQPSIVSIEDASVSDLTIFLTSHCPDAVIWAAGAGGKGDKSRTNKVDFEGAVKVYDAMEAANVKRLLYVGAIDVRTRKGDYPEYYNEASREKSDKVWAAIPAYMQAKLSAEQELHTRRGLQYTVVRPGALTEEAAGGVEMGTVQLGNTSRELVAQSLLACAKEVGTAGLTFDVMDGKGTIQQELAKVVENKVDDWRG